MKDVITRTRIALGAAAVLAIVIVPVAFAAGGGSGPQATASGVKKKVKKLTQRVDELAGQLAALQGEQGGGRPPTGPAGGGLTGTYPNPLIANNAVGSAQVQDNSLTADDLGTDSVNADEIAQNAVQSDEIQNDAVGSSEIAASSVTASELAGFAPRFGTVTVNGGAAENGAYVVESTAANCLAGEELVSGNGWWLNDANPGSDEELFISETEVNLGGNSVVVQGGNDSGTNRILVAQANCAV